MQRFINVRYNKRFMAKTKGATPETTKKQEALPSDPIEFARKLKKLVSEDFINSYRSIKKIVVKH